MELFQESKFCWSKEPNWLRIDSSDAITRKHVHAELHFAIVGSLLIAQLEVQIVFLKNIFIRPNNGVILGLT